MNKFLYTLMDAKKILNSTPEDEIYQMKEKMSDAERICREITDKMGSIKKNGDLSKKERLEKEMEFRDCLFNPPEMPSDFGMDTMESHVNDLKRYAERRIGYAFIHQKKDILDLRELWNVSGSDNVIDFEWDGPGEYEVHPVEEYSQRAQRTFWVRKFKRAALKATMETK